MQSFSYEIGNGRRLQIMKDLFSSKTDTWRRNKEKVESSPFIMEELELACSKFKAGRALRLDRIMPETIKKAIEVAPTVVLEIMKSLATIMSKIPSIMEGELAYS
ncbi:hypothetical protein JTB14_021583 [Gonioctena quinquepunctata]|nr:hypothetical protein JTB14_021583 [Gonioctena quinquepunctata]